MHERCGVAKMCAWVRPSRFLRARLSTAGRALDIVLSVPCVTGFASLGLLIAALAQAFDENHCSDILVLLKPRRSARLLPPVTLVSGYGFTRRESRVAAELANGSAVPKAALKLNIAEQAAHTHLLQLFEKTNTGRQAELVRMLQSGA